MNVNGETMLFKNDFGYSTSISKKNMDGSYENMAVVVQFRRDDLEAQRIPHKTKINIKNGFLTFYNSTSGEKKLKIIVLDYEVVGMKREEKTEENYQDPFDNMAEDNLFTDDDLPF